MALTQLHITLNPAHLAMALAAAGVKDVRFYLNTVYVDLTHVHKDGTVWLVGTDGHRMHYLHLPKAARAHDGAKAPAVHPLRTHASHTGVLLDAPALAAALKAGKGSEAVLELTIDDTPDTPTRSASRTTTALLQTYTDTKHTTPVRVPVATLDDATYPDWRRVVPASVPTLAAAAAAGADYAPGVQPAYLADIERVLRTAYRLTPRSQNNAIIVHPSQHQLQVTAPAVPGFGGVIMQMKTEKTGRSLPPTN